MKSLIIFVTNHAFLGETKDPNGTYAPELTHALKEFDEANVSYDIASIKGGESPLYGTDIDSDETNKSYLADPKFQEKTGRRRPANLGKRPSRNSQYFWSSVEAYSGFPYARNQN